MIVRCVPVVILLVAAMAVLSVSQERFAFDPRAEQTFSEGLRLFQSGKFKEASARFDELVQLQPVHQRTTAAYIMSAKSYLQSKDYEVAAARASALLGAFPTSSYRGDALLVIGVCDMMRQQYTAAAETLLLAADEASADSSLMEEAISSFTMVASDRLDTETLEALFRKQGDRLSHDLLAVALADNYRAAGDLLRVKDALSMVSPGTHPAPLEARLQHLRQFLASNVVIKVGVLLPLAAPPSNEGVTVLANDVYDGIQYAVDEFNAERSSGVDIALEVDNVGADTSSLSQLREFLHAENLMAVIGPLFSNHALLCAPLADAERIPMISPTANADGIAATSRYVFQTNPDLSTRGKAMARYAVSDLGLKRLAVLASSSQQSKGLADAFVQEARGLGADIAAYETYSKDTTDLRDQFMKIREAGATNEPSVSFTEKFTRAQLRSMVLAGADPELLREASRKKQIVAATELFGPNGKAVVDSLHLPFIVTADETYNLEVPISGIDGVFACISGGEEIGVLSSQLSYFNVHAKLLGSAEWYDLPQLEANKRYDDGMTFFSDNFVDPQDSAYRAFEQAFQRAKRRAPTRNTLYGYDTMKLLLSLIAQGATTREQLAAALANEHDFQGLHSVITLRGRRVNSRVHILQFKNNTIIRIADVNVD